MTKNWASAFTHPQLMMVKKYMSQILNDRFSQNEELLERITPALVTQQDLEAFGRLIADIYEIAYLKCMEDHRAALEKSGQKAIIVPGSLVENSNPIF
jgi:hypothetical protein